jgi:hypothetical protein
VFSGRWAQDGIADPGMPREIVVNRSSSVGTPSQVEMMRKVPEVKSRGRG